MNACKFLEMLVQNGIETIAGVPDSTLKQFCDEVQNREREMKHYVTANEGAAVGIAIGSFLASGKPACVYMQNSGIGNAVNPLASLANEDVYGIPLLFIVGWRGAPGIKDEPQHVFQGKITCELFQTLAVPYCVIDRDTTDDEMHAIMGEAVEALKENKQYAIIVKKGTFEKSRSYGWVNGNTLNREKVLGCILKLLGQEVAIISTTGKISRELYEQSNKIFGNHDNIFMTVGGMGHASMIALGIAKECPDRKVVCIDGDGAALMHLGAFPFIAEQAPDNFYHIVINNKAHESVGAMPTGSQKTNFAQIAMAAGYVHTEKIETMEKITLINDIIKSTNGPIMFEVPVSLGSREDLGRPEESAKENKERFVEWLRLS